MILSALFGTCRSTCTRRSSRVHHVPDTFASSINMYLSRLFSRGVPVPACLFLDLRGGQAAAASQFFFFFFLAFLGFCGCDQMQIFRASCQWSLRKVSNKFILSTDLRVKNANKKLLSIFSFFLEATSSSFLTISQTQQQRY